MNGAVPWSALILLLVLLGLTAREEASVRAAAPSTPLGRSPRAHAAQASAGRRPRTATVRA